MIFCWMCPVVPGTRQRNQRVERGPNTSLLQAVGPEQLEAARSLFPKELPGASS